MLALANADIDATSTLHRGRLPCLHWATQVLGPAHRCVLLLLTCILLTVSIETAHAQGPGQTNPVQPVSGRPVIVIDIKGAIGFVASQRLSAALARASTEAASVLIVRLDTPGGLLSSTREMVQTLIGARVPVVMFVAPSGARAASAGTYLLYASHIAAMAPGTHLGAATPIPLSVPGIPSTPPSKPDPEARKQPDTDPASISSRKSINDAVAYIRTLAELRNRNADWGEKAVRDAATLTAATALREHVIDIVANDIDDLLVKIDGRTLTTAVGPATIATKGQRVTELAPDWKMQLMSVIADPNIALILMMIGIYGIAFEFLNPGSIAPGVIGSISLLVALAALSVLPVNFAGLALLLLGIALMTAEKFLPSFGIAGLGGIVAFVTGAVFLFDPAASDVPLAIAWQVIAAVTLLTAGFVAGVVGLAMQARRRPVRTGAEELIGSLGQVVSWSGSDGRVLVHGELWSASAAKPLAMDAKVRVVSRTGLKLMVEPCI